MGWGESGELGWGSEQSMRGRPEVFIPLQAKPSAFICPVVWGSPVLKERFSQRS